jgi:hypothetical protein
VIPHTVLHEAGVSWGDRVNLAGRVRFLQDARLDDAADHVHHARPLIVFVDELEGTATLRSGKPIIISPVALFGAMDPDDMDPDDPCYHQGPEPRYTFVQCALGDDSELDAAAEWIEKYAKKYAGRVITNFDEQRPLLADAPLSYQRLVSKTYDRTVIKHFAGTVVVDRIDKLVHEETTTQYFGDMHMGHNINVKGHAIIAIESTLNNVTQTIGTAQGLDANQKSQLEAMVQSLKAELDDVKSSHPDEAKEIADAVEKAVANASKPPEQRKQSLLQLSAKGLKDAAELIKDSAPNILETAGLIAKFIVGLSSPS